MLCKTMMALLATAALIALAPQSAFARGGHGGFGGFHGGGGGWHGGGVAAFRSAPIGGGVAFRQAAVVSGPHVVGGFHSGFHPGFRRRAIIAGAVAGAAYAGPYGYGYYDSYDPYYAAYPDQVYPDQVYPNQVYYDGGYVETSCTVMRERVLTRYGWRHRTVQVCE